LNWHFVQHDLHRMPWPFEDGQFDYIMLKDLSLVVPLGIPSQRFMDEVIRITCEGGVVEVWESDHVLRSLAPRVPFKSTETDERAVNDSTRTYFLTPGLSFVLPRNKYIQDSNTWIKEALDRRRLPSAPCSRIADDLEQEDRFSDIDSIRVAIPLTELTWEKEHFQSRKPHRYDRLGPSSKGRLKSIDTTLSPDQAALRRTALQIVLQKVESLEPVLKDASGKNTEEWATWWAGMMSSLLDQDGASGGECFEIGAWWATKRTE